MNDDDYYFGYICGIIFGFICGSLEFNFIATIIGSIFGCILIHVAHKLFNKHKRS